MTLLIIFLAIAIAILGIYVHRQNKKIEQLELRNQTFREVNEKLRLTIQDFQEISQIVNPGRAVGNTTRLINYFIQDLFERGYTVVKDHHDTHEMDEYIMKRILTRLSTEHPHVKIKTHLGFKKIELV